ncbi:NADPH-dependent oxidoreductase [Mesorhizobium sp. M0142]|uniref:NADPH-dependent oxidoreductase n=1 Tax=unclassified Mesorhizobium TaxID=325217 RepID=UPI0003CF16F8|nr:NADPH-dependent oxidoreductase [Mesorhizobium sp. LSHC420B00]ESX82329.1 nitroreductase [Mesorhizobium sp. LSHC420B00]
MSQPAAFSIRPSDADLRGEAALRRRYRAPQSAHTGNWNEALEAILSHRSVRNYLARPLPEGTLELIVAAAQSAPTSSNLQAWSVVAVEDPARKARLAGLAAINRHIEQAPLLLVWLADLSRLRTIAKANGRAGEGLDYQESFLLAVIDAALAAQNAVVAIDALGLGSCYIGAMRNHPQEVARELGLPPETVAMFGLTVGCPDLLAATDIKPRLPQTVVLHRERYQSAPHPDDLAAYNQTLRTFQQEQSMPEVDWTELMSNRIGSTAALKGRDRLGEVLKALGFKLK